MRFFGHHGHLEAERVVGSHLDVDVELRADLRPAGASDALGDTIDYARCFALVRGVVEGEQHHLLERVATRVAEVLLAETPARGVRVRVSKRPPLEGSVERCAVVIDRERMLK